MIGDGDVLEPRLARRRGHRPDVVLAVGFGAVHVEVAAQIGEIDEPRERAGRGGVELAAHLAQLGRNPVEAERGVDLLLALAGDANLVGDPEQAVLVQLEALADGAVAQRDVVGLRSGEVLQRGAAAVGGDEAQVGLEAALDEDARFRLAVAEHALDQTVLDEVVHQRRRRAGGEQVEVAAGVAAAPQAADRLDRGIRRALAQVGHERGGGIVRVGQQVAAGEALPLVERLQDQRFLLRAHAAKRANPAVERRALEIVEVRMPSSRYSVATVFGPTPWRCRRSRMVGGNSAISSRW